MAGGKETPRQKMIGMMYLVLLALLALQVSGAVLDKFFFMNLSLENSVEQTNLNNSQTVQKIQKQVKESGDREDDVKVLSTATTVRNRTNSLLEEMNGLKEEIIKITGGRDPESGAPAGLKDEETLANLMIVQKKGEELKNKLNQYVTFLNSTAGTKVTPIAYDGKDHPVFKDNPNQNKKDFAALNFANTPMVAGLATITQFETEVLAREQEALDALAAKVGAQDVKFDKIVPMVNAESNVVAAGTKYEAEMFIAASSSGMKPDMFVNGKAIPVNADGRGKVEFTATGGNYDKEGLIKKSFDAEIKVKLPGGREESYPQKIDYFVAKPVIQIQSASVQALYLQCGNQLNVQVPALGNQYNPNFSASGASVIEGKKKGEVTVVPTAANVTLNVSSGGNAIGSEKFGVRRVPKPEIIPTSGGREVNQKQGVSASALRSLTMQAEADESFKQFLPNDARFRVTEYTVTLARGNRPVAPPMTVKGPNANLSQFVSKAKPGDRYVIEVTDVKRMNFRDQVIDVPMGTKTFTIPLN